MIPVEWLQEARGRLAGKVLQTPLLHDEDQGLYLKLENLQLTGSFKYRGALNRILTLQEEEREKVVTASAGNHGLGVARAVKDSGGHAVIFVSDHAVPEKVKAIQNAGEEIRAVQGGYGEAEAAAIQFAQETGGTFISPYNDGQVIAGQSTVGAELVGQLDGEDLKTVIVPVGGGGLLAGIGLALQASGRKACLIGVNPAQSHFFYSLLKTGSQKGVEDNPTLADGLAGALDPGSITLPILKSLNAEMLLADEEEIREAILKSWFKYGQKVEGSAAAGLAVAKKLSPSMLPAAVILTGGNIQSEVFTSLIGSGQV